MARNAAAEREASRDIRNVLVIARQAAGLTLTELAERIGCLPKQLSQWEHANVIPSVNSTAAWADALGYEIALLPKTTERPEDEQQPECVATATCCAMCIHDLGECCKHQREEADGG